MGSDRRVGWSVPRAWVGATVVCLGGGPSLTAADVAYCRGRARVIAVNDAYRLAPWADVLYACDDQWWTWHAGAADYRGVKVGRLEPKGNTWPDVNRLIVDGDHGLSTCPTALRAGHNSGYQAINLAVLFGAARVVLLGYDLQGGATGSHWFGEHPGRVQPPFAAFLETFPTLVAPLAALGVEIVNATVATALECFPRRPLREVLAHGL